MNITSCDGCLSGCILRVGLKSFCLDMKRRYYIDKKRLVKWLTKGTT